MAQYIRITNPWFLEQDTDGRPAAGYRVYTLAAGTVATLATTYSDKDLTAPNTNPIVLNAYGECHIFTNVALKLVYTSPTGDLTSPIWTEDYCESPQSNFTTGLATPVTLNNNYIVATVPAITTLAPNFMLIMTPDIANTDTIGTTTYTPIGLTGINDLTATGPYLGAAPATFTMKIDATVQAAPMAATLAENVAVGLVTVGDHSIKLVALTAGGHTEPGPISNVVSAAGVRKLDVTGIPAVAGEVTGYDVYMNKAGGTTWYLVNAAPITTTTYTIDIADATLGTGVYVAAPTTNTTAGAGVADTFTWKKDGGAWHPGVVITGANQTLVEGFTVKFAVVTGHTYGDIWATATYTPARLNLDGLGSFLIYKNKGGAVVPLDGNDMLAGYPAQLILNEALNGWLLTNPATPTFSTPTISAVRYRKNITTTYAMLAADEGYELSCIGTFTVSLLTAPEFSGKFFYIKNAGTGIITVDAGASYLIWGLGTRYYYLGAHSAIQLASNGVDWHVLTTTGTLSLVAREAVDGLTVTINNLLIDTRYRLVAQVVNAAGTDVLGIRFNADGGVNYQNAGMFVVDASTAAPYTAHGATSIPLVEASVIGSEILFEVEFITSVADPHKVYLVGNVTQFYTTYLANRTVSGYWAGAADLASVTLFKPTTKYTGIVYLYMYN